MPPEQKPKFKAPKAVHLAARKAIRKQIGWISVLFAFLPQIINIIVTVWESFRQREPVESQLALARQAAEPFGSFQVGTWDAIEREAKSTQVPDE